MHTVHDYRRQETLGKGCFEQTIDVMPHGCNAVKEARLDHTAQAHRVLSDGLVALFAYGA